MELNKEKAIYTTKVLSSLVKVFPEEEPKFLPEATLFTALQNEIVSFQVAICSTDETASYVKVSVDSPISDAIRIRTVELVPVAYSAHKETDDNYLRTTPGMYPDLLCELYNSGIMVSPALWSTLWLDIDVTDSIKAGTYPIKVTFSDKETGDEVCSATTNITVYGAVLPKQTLINTEWFHADCLANYYNVAVFSDEHWRIMKNFIKTAVKYGINMILTPEFTPPLDTAKGGERTTVQLIDITVANGEYSFDFDNLKKWVDICLSVGIEYFEMSHLFSQWGATAAPKVMATVDGKYKQIFGWDTKAVGGEYTVFLNTYLPQLTAKLKEWGIAEKTFFHISDEPQLSQLDTYTAAKNSVADSLKGFRLMDALSDYEFYKTGAVETPVSANNHIHSFLEHNVKNVWSYYCTGQYKDVCNHFISMPSLRNRIYGVQLFKYDIEGTLQWGYNFYNSQYSLFPINPYRVTDSVATFPAGDPFLVYPNADGTPEESLRLIVHYHGMADLRAMNYLAELAGKDFVMDLIEGDLSTPITFEVYPKSDTYLLTLRNRINREIAKRV